MRHSLQAAVPLPSSCLMSSLSLHTETAQTLLVRVKTPPLLHSTLFSHVSQPLSFLPFISPPVLCISPSLSLSLWLDPPFSIYISPFLTPSINLFIHSPSAPTSYAFSLPLHCPPLSYSCFHPSVIFSQPTLSPPRSLSQLPPPASSHHG